MLEFDLDRQLEYGHRSFIQTVNVRSISEPEGRIKMG